MFKYFFFTSVFNFLIFIGYITVCIFIIYSILRKRKILNSFKKNQKIIISFALFAVLSVLTLVVNGSVFFFCLLDGPYVGQVIESDTGEPISGAQVVITWKIIHVNIVESVNTAEVYECSTDINGRFFIPIASKWSAWPFSLFEQPIIFIYKTGYLSYPPRLTLSVQDYDSNRCIDKMVYFFKYRVKFSKFKNNIVRLNKALSIEEQFIATKNRGLSHLDSKFRHKFQKTATLIETDRNKLPFKNKFEEKYLRWSVPKERPFDGRFEALENEVILDNCSGLMWAREDNGRPISWEAAKRYCDNYQGGGYSDWRLPTIAELETLYEYRTYNKASSTISTNEQVAEIPCRLNNLFKMSNCWLWASETNHGKSAFYNFSMLQWDYIRPSNWRHTRVLPVRSAAGFQKRNITDKFNIPYKSR